MISLYGIWSFYFSKIERRRKKEEEEERFFVINKEIIRVEEEGV